MSTVLISDALAHARLLPPALAEQQASEILRAVPDHPEALLILARALRLQGKLGPAMDILAPLVRGQPRAASVHLEWALAQAALGETDAAIAAVEVALRLKPKLAGAWRHLGDLLAAAGRMARAEAAYARHVEAAVHEPALMQAARAMLDGALADAERGLTAHLQRFPTDVAALRMLAEVCTRLGRDREAQAGLARCLDLHPGFVLARHNLAVVLYRQNKPVEALPHLERLRAQDGHNASYASLHAACLAMIGANDAAIGIYAGLLGAFPQQPKIWLGYGHVLKTAGRRAESVAAYRTAMAQAPGMGEAYWSLANMKTARFSADEMRAMGAQLARTDLPAEDRFHLHYALGHVLEQAGDYAQSWAQYAEGARLRRAEIEYDAGQTTAQLDRTRALMTHGFFEERAGMGCADEAPIFIVGLPRSGSTLIEQILSSHSQVEGTMELPELATIAREIGAGNATAYPDILADLTPTALHDLGARYLHRTRIYRRSNKPIFIDKMPNNFVHVGLIHLILPRAKIIDARRHPMAACFSAFKQHFAKGQHYTYDLAELGRYYRDYADLMDHFDVALPGRVRRVRYEDMVQTTEQQTRVLLAHCGLAFEEACLRFHENPRAVRTASSEQVRRPIFREGLHHWRNYEPWLGTLADTLGRKQGVLF